LGKHCILCSRIRPNEAFGGKGERARLVFDVGTATPYRRRRIRILARERRDVLQRMEEAGQIMPLPPRQDFDSDDCEPNEIDPIEFNLIDIGPSDFDPRKMAPCDIDTNEFGPSDIDPTAAWHEWVQHAENDGDE
jgi:hypothetical protein